MSQIEYDWDKIPTGSTFTAIIQDVRTSGRIYKNKDEYNRIYLCQNKLNGADAPDKLGYEYSWSINGGSLGDLIKENVRNLKVWLPEPGYKLKVFPKVSIGSFPITYFNNGNIKVGCTKVPFKTIEAIYKFQKKI